MKVKRVKKQKNSACISIIIATAGFGRKNQI